MVEEIEKLRRQIDRTDQVMITALAERMSYMPEIAKYKHDHNIPVYQETRDQDIMEKMLKLGTELGLDESYVEEVFLSIFNEAKRLQQETINKLED